MNSRGLNWRHVGLSVLWLGAAVLAVGWAKVHLDRNELIEAASRWSGEDRKLQRERTAIDEDLEKLEPRFAELQQRAVSALSAADRARPKVGDLIARLKAAHAVKPPPAPIPPPPQGPKGMFFPELMDDPEYRRCYALISRPGYERREGTRLRQLGLPEGTVERIVDLMVERNMQVLLTNGKVSRTVPGTRDKKAEIDHEIRDLIGEKYAEYQKGGSAAAEGAAHMVLQKLQYRLAYSGYPLGAAQVESVVSAFSQGDRDWRTLSLTNDAVVAEVERLLSIEQRSALLALQEEAKASEQRSKLPKVETTHWNAPKR